MWDSATANVITGNLIGTDSSGTEPLGNRGAGVWITEGARRNVVGPSNLIAHNGDSGVLVTQANSTGNTITRDSFLGNARGGIRVDPGISSAPAPPLIWDSNSAAGTVTGAVLACPGCQVEIFSDGGRLGTVFEAQIAADANGAFALDAGRPFAGPSLRATVTAADGSTSDFSIPATGTVQSIGVLQEGNVAPREVFVARMGHELEDNKIGTLYSGIGTVYECDPADPTWLSAHLDSLGLTWLRLSFGPGEWSEVQGTGPGEWSEVQATGRYTPMSFSECQDRLIDDLNQRGVTIVYNLIFFDEQLQIRPDFLRFRTEKEVQDFLEYARMVATHLRGRVEYYKVWNEPDIWNYGQQSIALPDYVDMVRRLVPVIRAADPQAKIVVGDTSDLRLQEVRDYTMGILESDIMPLVDGVALHPMYGSSPDYDELRQYYYDYPDLIQTIKDTAAAHGFTGEYFASEMSWRTPDNTNDYEVWSYSETVAAKYYARGIIINRGLGMLVTIGAEGYPTVDQVLRNLNTVLAGAEPADLTVEVESASDLARSYTLSLSNEDRLIAVWIDGVATDDDPGIAATVTVEGMTAGEVTGIDVLYGYQQEIVTQMEDGSLVIHDMLVRDYPILLRLSGVKSTR